MSLDEELAELLAGLGVTLETPEQPGADPARGMPAAPDHAPGSASEEVGFAAGPYAFGSLDESACAVAEVSLFQTSREHYGVFYRLDLVEGIPQLRVFTPDEEGPVKMRCFLVRPAPASPVRAWFAASRGYDGSAEYQEVRDNAEQHLLFAAGEALKRLFWSGDPDAMTFPAEIAVLRLL